MPIRAANPDWLLKRFCRTGDPAVLGALFDRTAAELLRVAVWLCGNRNDAEDLLQRTFVSVIESRASFDPRRGALPWLCGILANHARRLQEQRARRLPAVREPAGERDPAEVAADAELMAAVAKLKGELGPPYREVLELHLGQGLNAKEIAERLGRPAGTVRTQLVRGRVVDEHGVPMASGVSAHRGIERKVYTVATEAAAGTFVLGPLPADAYDVSVIAPGRGIWPCGNIRLEPRTDVSVTSSCAARAGPS
jgi:RNA polymerase sigma factor (sigma-70 family)